MRGRNIAQLAATLTEQTGRHVSLNESFLDGISERMIYGEVSSEAGDVVFQIERAPAEADWEVWAYAVVLCDQQPPGASCLHPRLERRRRTSNAVQAVGRLREDLEWFRDEALTRDAGEIVHEFVLGDKALQDAHEREMQEMEGRMMTHDEPNAVAVELGDTKLLAFRFTEAVEIEYACHEPGHYAAGMHAPLTVS